VSPSLYISPKLRLRCDDDNDGGGDDDFVNGVSGGGGGGDSSGGSGSGSGTGSSGGCGRGRYVVCAPSAAPVVSGELLLLEQPYAVCSPT
jgi:hypothetical protein